MSQTGTWAVKVGLAQMLKGGVIMDVVTPEHARIAEEAGACRAANATRAMPIDASSKAFRYVQSPVFRTGGSCGFKVSEICAFQGSGRAREPRIAHEATTNGTPNRRPTTRTRWSAGGLAHSCFMSSIAKCREHTARLGQGGNLLDRGRTDPGVGAKCDLDQRLLNGCLSGVLYRLPGTVGKHVGLGFQKRVEYQVAHAAFTKGQQ